MSLRRSWKDLCLKLALEPADFYVSGRKIRRNVSATFEGELDDSMTLADAGFTKSKLTMLTRHYYHAESVAVAVQLWKQRRKQAKYGSVCFTTFNHFVKGHIAGKAGEIKGTSKRASILGPCIQSVVLTYLPDKSTAIDVFYRTTEVFKKFPADLVLLRDVLLKDFDLGTVSTMTFHFANVTVHPMYFVTVIPSIPNPIYFLDRLKKADPYFFSWVVKWSARYLCKEHLRGIEKFSQAMRVRKDVMSRIGATTMKTLQAYLRKNHPGYRNAYVPPEDDDE